MTKINIFWFRRDLRLHDNAGLYYALKNKQSVLPIFIFDTNILDDLEDKQDPRVHFIYNRIQSLSKELGEHGSSILVKYGKPEEVWQGLLKKWEIEAVYTNHDYEPYAKQRDEAIKLLLEKKGIALHTFKDHVIFEKDEILKPNGTPYIIFTPYARRWRGKLDSMMMKSVTGEVASFYLTSYPTEKYFSNFFQTAPFRKPSLLKMGFAKSSIKFPSTNVKRSVIKKYEAKRDYPALEGTSKLGIHYRFGTISIREKVRIAMSLSPTYVNELIWRDFYAMILWQFPNVVKEPFKARYAYIEWRNNEEEFEAWCAGKTGYPLVDAGMRELNATGYMHNRVRMVTASFLTKHLLIDWKWGEAYFAKKLLDFDLASNNGGWQWAAGCGTDAAPYFRIFNPITQMQKFDENEEYIKKWVEEFGTDAYPQPIVEHKMARERCLRVYKAAVAR